jgi:hypothetical protein
LTVPVVALVVEVAVPDDACTAAGDESGEVDEDVVVDVLAGACEPPQAASVRTSAASFIPPFYSAA